MTEHGKALAGFFNTDQDYDKAWVDLNELVGKRILDEAEADVTFDELELEVPAAR